MRITSGEMVNSDFTVGSTWGYTWEWAMRDGAFTIEQHNYMIFRYLYLEFIDGFVPEDFAMDAWGVRYEWHETDSSFTSSNATLTHVWNLCRNTVRDGVVDTYTDSNTRERRPYEADGMIAATARNFMQRDFMWSRYAVR